MFQIDYELASLGFVISVIGIYLEFVICYLEFARD